MHVWATSSEEPNTMDNRHVLLDA